MIALYNKILHLRNTAEQAVEDMCDTTNKQLELIDTIIDALDEDTFKTDTLHKQSKKREKATTPYKQAEIIEILWLWCITHEHQFTSTSKEIKKILQNISKLDHELWSIKRFFNETVREYNERIQTFPVNLIGSIMKLEPLKSFSLYTEDKHGIWPETKYL